MWVPSRTNHHLAAVTTRGIELCGQREVSVNTCRAEKLACTASERGRERKRKITTVNFFCWLSDVIFRTGKHYIHSLFHGGETYDGGLLPELRMCLGERLWGEE